MSRRFLSIGLCAGLAISALGLSARPASALPPVIVPVAASSAWPVWVLAGGVVGIMIRAAYVYNTECRELTQGEAFGGTLPIWPAYHVKNNRCGAPARHR